MKFYHFLLISLLIFLNVLCKSFPNKTNVQLNTIINSLEKLYLEQSRDVSKYDNLYQQYVDLIKRNPDYIKHPKNISKVLLFIDKLKTSRCTITIHEPQEMLYVSTGYSSPIRTDFVCSNKLPYMIEVFSNDLTFQNHARRLFIDVTAENFTSQIKITSASFDSKKNIFYFIPHIYGEKFITRLKRDMNIRSRKLNVLNIYEFLLSKVPSSATRFYENYEGGNQEAQINSGISIDNQDTKVAISASGQFTLGGRYKNQDYDFLYGHPNSVDVNGIGTSFVTVQINNKNYKLHLNDSMLKEKDNGIVEYHVTIKKENVTVIQTLTPLPEKDWMKTMIQFKIVNHSNKKKKIGLRLLLDTWTDKKDGQAFLLPIGGVAKLQQYEMEFSATTSPMWQTFDQIQLEEDNSKDLFFLQQIFMGDGLIVPNKTAIVKWSDAQQSNWSYTINTQKKITGDTGAMMWWNPVIVSPKKELKIATSFAAFIQKKRPHIFKINEAEGIYLVHLWHHNKSSQIEEVEYNVVSETNSIVLKSKLYKTSLDPHEMYFKSFPIQINHEQSTKIRIIEKINKKKKIYIFPFKNKHIWNRLSVISTAKPSAKIPVLYFTQDNYELKVRLKNLSGKIISQNDLIKSHWSTGYQYIGNIVAPSKANGRYTVEVYHNKILATKDIMIVPQKLIANNQIAVVEPISKREVTIVNNNDTYDEESTVKHKKKSKWKYRYEIYFPSKSIRITRSQLRKLRKFKIKKNSKVHIYGFTNSRGSKKRNLRLSKQRARKIYRYLKKRHPRAKYIVTYYGEKYPLYTNKTQRGRNGNERVVVKIK